MRLLQIVPAFSARTIKTLLTSLGDQLIVSVAVVPAVTSFRSVGVKTNVLGVDGASVSVLTHVAPAGIESPASAKPEVPTLNCDATHGA